MLIRAVKAENFMRFARLHIRNLPVRGLIGIEGPNESGKTSLGEAILFAFFGRTRLSTALGVERLIRWEADQLTVEVEFETGEGESFLLYREIDRSGTNYVKLIDARSREEIATGNRRVDEKLSELIRFDYEEALDSFYLHQLDHIGGVKPRSTFLERMTGAAQIEAAKTSLQEDIEALEREFAQFSKDIQRNEQQIQRIDENLERLEERRAQLADHDDKAARLAEEDASLRSATEELRRLSGSLDRDGKQLKGCGRTPLVELDRELEGVAAKYADLRGAAGALGEFVKENSEGIERQERRLDEIRSFSRELADLRGELGELETEHEKQVDRESEGGGLLLVELEEAKQALDSNRTACRVASFFAGLSLVFATVFGALVVVLLMRLPGDETLREQLRALSPSMEADRGIAILGLIAGVTLVFFLTFLARRFSLGGRAQTIRDRIHEADGRIEIAIIDRERLREAAARFDEGQLEEFFERVTELRTPEYTGRVAAFRESRSALCNPKGKKGYRKALDGLAQGERQLRQRVIDATRALEERSRENGKHEQKSSSDRDRIRNEIREFEAQRDRRPELVETGEEYGRQAAGVEAEIEARRVAIQLLDETSRAVLRAVGPAVARFVRSTLPKLTGDRYRDVQVDEELAVRLFTSEKCDFLEHGELSGGTLEGLELAVRLASSQAFLRFRAPQPQFIFLDEPFKMMDAGRILQALDVLGELSPDLCQVFVTQPEFSPTQRKFFDVSIRADIPGEELVVDASTAGPHSKSSDASPQPDSVSTPAERP